MIPGLSVRALITSSRLPAALIIAAEHDTLRDEAEAYAKKLQEQGVDARYSCYPGMIHGFLQMGGVVSEARQAIEEIATFLNGDGLQS